jgi:hypothetical protein
LLAYQNGALHVLVSFAQFASGVSVSKIDSSSPSAPSATVILRAKKQLEACSAFFMSDSQSAMNATTSWSPQAFVHTTVCIAWFFYCTDDMETCMRVCDAARLYMLQNVAWREQSVQTHTWQHLELELLQIARVRFALYASIFGVFSPSRFRSVLMDAMLQFPLNPQLLSLFIVSEARFVILVPSLCTVFAVDFILVVFSPNEFIRDA